ncbi:hypothetical protein HQQ92_05880 [Shewanella sp. DC2-4]|uniref:hypothetical protein n=1 Tax=Shewanella sp. DC2-4 TaxID=2739431 RepID=UPI001564E78F|nr:hypothetical protein [Shewanella sp. DC2-4]NRD31333.1 hypothetical protein [Shewanella sp. DC2-4]
MVKVRIIGGLGNQMFQYAAAKSLATKLNTDVSADVSAFNSYELHGFGLDKLNCICHFDTKNKFFLRLILFFLYKQIFQELRL